jgi:hypothetical protein
MKQCKECEEQARLLGISANKEWKLITQLNESYRTIKRISEEKNKLILELEELKQKPLLQNI